jgi:hypothetical protein
MLPDYVTRLRRKDIAKREKRERKNGTIKHEPLVEKCKSNLTFSSDYHHSAFVPEDRMYKFQPRLNARTTLQQVRRTPGLPQSSAMAEETTPPSNW